MVDDGQPSVSKFCRPEVDVSGLVGLYRGMGTDPARGSEWSPPADGAHLGFSDFFRREFDLVVRTVYLVLHDQPSAEDVAQDAFGQLYVNWEKVSGYDQPGAWVRRVAIRMAVRTARRDETRRSLSRGQSPHLGPSWEDVDLDLAAALRALPAQQRAAVALHYYEDRPAEEVGNLLGCSASTVRSHLARARTRLAEILTEDEVDHAE
jgi:RNA polymerase sigma-70 factor (ECF subfamily)